MTQERDLLDVLWLVSEPKQINPRRRTAIGGESIGVWSADNTEMFYPAALAPTPSSTRWSKRRRESPSGASVKVGLCIHAGVFYEVAAASTGPTRRPSSSWRRRTRAARRSW